MLSTLIDKRVAAAAEAVVGAKRFVLVTKANADLGDGACRGLLVGTPGTANLRQIDGTDRANVPLQQGYNPISVLQVRTGGTASDIWALY